jgi:hypothetical protein
MTTLLTFTHDEDEDGWCSACNGRASRGVSIRSAGATGGLPQISATFDPASDAEVRKGRDFHYRFGTCCIARMVTALEKKT